MIKKNEISDESKTALFDLENKFVGKFKAATEKGKERKRRVISVIFHKIRSYALITSLYQSILPISKSNVVFSKRHATYS